MDTMDTKKEAPDKARGGEEEARKDTARAVTIFLRKKNKPLATLSLNGETEEQVKYILIMKGYGDEMPEEKDWESMKQYILWEGKLTKKAKELGEKFDTKYRLLIIK